MLVCVFSSKQEPRLKHQHFMSTEQILIKTALSCMSTFTFKTYVLHTTFFHLLFLSQGFGGKIRCIDSSSITQRWFTITKALISTNKPFPNLKFLEMQSQDSYCSVVPPVSFYHCSLFISSHVSHCSWNPQIIRWMDRHYLLFWILVTQNQCGVTRIKNK